MGAVDILRDALFGNPPSPTKQPSREGVLAAFTSLYDAAVIAHYAALAGITIVSTIADRDAFYATPANRGKLVYVNNNNGSAADPANGVYEYVGGAARLAQSFYEGVATIVEPLVMEAESARDEAVAAAATVAPVTGALSAFYIQPIAYEQGSYSTTDGRQVASGPNFRRAILTTTPGEKFKFTGSITGGDAAAAVFYNSSGVFIPGSAQYIGADGVTTDLDEVEIVTPPGAGQIGFTGFAFTAAGLASPTLVKRLSLAGDTALTADDVKDSLSVYENVTFTPQNGAYFWPDGSTNTDANFRRVLLPTMPGEKLRYSGAVASGAQAAAIYFDKAGARIPNAERFVGVDGANIVYIDQEIESPAGAYSAGFTSYIFDPAGLAVQLRVKRPKVLPDAAQRILSGGGGGPEVSYWAGKKIVWFGTSIPEAGKGTQDSYPELVAEQIGATIANEALGSSSARFGVAQNRNVEPGDIYGLKGLSWFLATRSLGKTSAEAEDLIANWSTYRTFLDPASGPPMTLSLGEQAQIRDSSYEIKFARNADADLYVFDHGYNDWFANRFGTTAGATSGGSGDMLYAPTDPLNRGTYLGAMAYLIDKIRKINPRARILFISHYEDDRDFNVVQGQKVVAEATNYPFIKTYELLGWGGNQRVDTTGYWSGPTAWNASGGPSQNLLMTQVWMQDNLHPYSLPTRQIMADVIAAQIKLVR